MSWSLSYTGKPSVLPDSSHRILLSIEDTDLDCKAKLQDFCELQNHYFHHVSLHITSVISESNRVQLEQRLSSLNAMLRHQSDIIKVPLYLSVQIAEPTDIAVSILFSADCPLNLIVINLETDRESCLQSILRVQQQMQSAGVATHLGAGNVRSIDDADWLFQRLPAGTLKVMHLGDIAYPDLHCRAIELANSFGCNPVVGVTAEGLAQISGCARLGALAEGTYNVSSETLLGKCLLQLGAAIDLPLRGVDSKYLLGHFGRLVHPFVHRKEVASAVRVVSLQVSPADLQKVVDASDEREATGDGHWLQFATGRSQDRVLSY